MNLKQKQKLAALKSKREAFLDAYVGAQLKRANVIKEIKPFSSVVTFLDELDNVPVLSLSHPVPNAQSRQAKVNRTKQPPLLDQQVNAEKRHKQKKLIQRSKFDHYAEE